MRSTSTLVFSVESQSDKITVPLLSHMSLKSACHMAVMSLSSKTFSMMVYLVQAILNRLWRMSWSLKEEMEIGMRCSLNNSPSHFVSYCNSNLSIWSINSVQVVTSNFHTFLRLVSSPPFMSSLLEY